MRYNLFILGLYIWLTAEHNLWNIMPLWLHIIYWISVIISIYKVNTAE